MLTMAAIRNPGGFEEYLEGQAEQRKETDPATGAVRYFSDYGEPPGRWVSGVEALGRKEGDILKAGELARIFEGKHPVTGEVLVPPGANGVHQAGWDCTYTAPKSISAIWAVSGKELQAEIEAAHHSAVKQATEYLSDKATWARRGKAGAEIERVRLITAEYQHSTSRADSEPHLHSHCVTANMAKREDGTWGAIESRELYKHQKASGAVYHSQLAARMERLGFDVERGAGGTFKVSGVPQDVVRAWSTRAEQIRAEMLEAGVGGTGEAHEIAWAKTRAEKQYVHRDELRARWTEQGREMNWTGETAEQLRQGSPREHEDMTAIQARTLERMVENQSTFTEAELTRTLANESWGQLDAEALREEVAWIMDSPEIVRLDVEDHQRQIMTTRRHLEREKEMVQTFERMAKDDFRVSVSRHEAAERELSPEQLKAVDTLTGPERLANLQGWAGTGKSRSLAAVRERYEAAGCEVRGCALSAQAAKELEGNSGIQSETVAKTLYQLEKGEITLSDRSVLVIDEAAMLDTPQLRKLTLEADRAGAKLVLVGDDRQLAPIGPGGGFRAAKEVAPTAEISEIRRQKDEWARKAVKDLAIGEAEKALAEFDRRGLVTTGGKGLERQMVADWHRDGADGLMLAATRAEVRELNQAAREKLQETGQLGQDRYKVQTMLGKAGVVEQDLIMFRKNSKALGVRNGETARITAIQFPKKGDGLIIEAQKADGEKVAWNTADYENFHHGYAATVHKSQGATVERAYYLAGDRDSRNMAYVAASRARGDTRIYIRDGALGREEAIKAAGYQLSRDGTKKMALDRPGLDKEQIFGSRQEGPAKGPGKDVGGKAPAADRGADRGGAGSGAAGILAGLIREITKPRKENERGRDR